MTFKTATCAFFLLAAGTCIFAQTAHQAEASQPAGEQMTAPAPSAEESLPGQAVVSEIRIDGLRKTRNSYLQALLKKYRGITAGELDLRAVETTLQAEGIFESIQTELTDRGDGTAVLHISVKEKLSFIPLPFAASSNGSAMGGLFIIDTNAFGVKDMFVVGGIFSKSTLMGMAQFAKPSLSLTQPGWAFGASASKSSSTFTDLHDDEILTYDSMGFNVHAAITDRLTEHSHVSLGLAYRQISISDAQQKNGSETWAESYRALSPSLSWSMSTQDWNGCFLSTKSLSASGSLSFYTDGTKAPAAAASLHIEQPFLSPRLRFIMQTSGAIWHKEHISQLGGGSAVGVAILPDDFHSPRLAGASGGFEFAFAKARWALFSLYASYQAAFSEDSDGDGSFTHGVTGGTKMYLTKIAFPAFAFGVAYNVPLSLFKYSVAFGISL